MGTARNGELANEKQKKNLYETKKSCFSDRYNLVKRLLLCPGRCQSKAKERHPLNEMFLRQKQMQLNNFLVTEYGSSN